MAQLGRQERSGEHEEESDGGSDPAFQRSGWWNFLLLIFFNLLIFQEVELRRICEYLQKQHYVDNLDYDWMRNMVRRVAKRGNCTLEQPYDWNRGSTNNSGASAKSQKWKCDANESWYSPSPIHIVLFCPWMPSIHCACCFSPQFTLSLL